jgi:hypothetical protein
MKRLNLPLAAHRKCWTSHCAQCGADRKLVAWPSQGGKLCRACDCERLRLAYRAAHPDVKRIRRSREQIAADLAAGIKAVRVQRAACAIARYRRPASEASAERRHGVERVKAPWARICAGRIALAMDLEAPDFAASSPHSSLIAHPSAFSSEAVAI